MIDLRSGLLPTTKRHGGWGLVRPSGRQSPKFTNPCSGHSKSNKCQDNLITCVHFYDITKAYGLAFRIVIIIKVNILCLHILIHLILKQPHEVVTILSFPIYT